MATEAEVLAALANTHLFIDPTIAVPKVRAGACPAGLLKRTVPGYGFDLCTPANTYLFRAPSVGLKDAILAWGDKPPAGWKNVGAWGNSTLYEAPAGIKPGALPQSLATLTAAALNNHGAGSSTSNAESYVAAAKKAAAEAAPEPPVVEPPEEKPAPPKSRAGYFLAAAGLVAGLAWLKPWK